MLGVNYDIELMENDIEIPPNQGPPANNPNIVPGDEPSGPLIAQSTPDQTLQQNQAVSQGQNQVGINHVQPGLLAPVAVGPAHQSPQSLVPVPNHALLPAQLAAVADDISLLRGLRGLVGISIEEGNEVEEGPDVSDHA
ncbi:hypothetical protein FRC07_002852 [Ceratobasidium sp. 392]|nr:hypothetical protein FRC07_002852 [Ceratobasidium sp. 392]